MTRTTAVVMGLVCGTAACAQVPAPAERGTGVASARIHRLEELRWPQVDALDRERTLFILPVGMLEVHGPHLPIGTDTISVLHEIAEVASRVSTALPEWSVVVMPPLSYGQGGANEIGGRLAHAGTYGIRQSTLRAVVADLGGQLAQNGFKWMFVLNGHGAPTHSIAISEASDFVSETFGVTMLHVTALLRGDAARQTRAQAIDARFFSADELASFGLDVHSGVGETAGMLAIRPDLVDPAYKTLPAQPARTREQLPEVASAAGWPGYFSDPAKASAAYGEAVETWWTEGFTDVIVRAARGENMLGRPRVPEAVPPAVAPALEKALANEAAFDAALQKWLAQQKTR